MKKTLCLFLLIATVSLFNGALAAEKITKINRLDYVNIPFWNNFNDQNLIDGLYKVYENNTDLKVTTNRVVEAQRLVRMSLANELPHIGFDGYVGQIFKSSDEVFGDITIPDYSEAHFLLPLTLNYEIDIWGKNHLKTKAQKKRFEMMQQEEKAVYIGLTSAYAADYYSLIKVDKLIQYQKELIETQKQVCTSIQKRYELGTATINDTIAEQKALTYLEEELNNLLEKQDVLQNQINVLIADRSFPTITRTDYDNLKLNISIPNEISINTLEKRPDWVKSELNLEKVGIDVKVAKRELLPKFILNGNLGFNAYSLASSNTFLANLGVAPTWDLFMGGRKIQYLKLQKNEYEIALKHYDKVILKSMQETNDALYSLKSNDKKHSISAQRLNLDEIEMNLMKQREEIGTADNLNLLIKKQQLLIAKKQETSLKINEVVAMINLYQALGGINYIGEKL